MAQLKDLIVSGAARVLGKLYASEFVGKLTGNADTSTKATQDSAGQQINTTYIKGLSVNGKTITYTKGNNTTGTITTQDTNTWRPLGTTADTACAGNDSRLSNARPASDVYSWAKASSKPSYSKSEVGLGNVDNTADSAKSVKYATTAGSASSATTASNVKDSNDGGATTFAYSKAGMNYGDYTWLAVWNGKEMRAANKNQFATAGHTHNYAGSSSAGGNANAAVKLATARSINGTNFDGSGNITTANWGTARTITVGNTGKSVNGSGNVSWSLGEIGVHVSNKQPAASDGKNGDVWIVYEG